MLLIFSSRSKIRLAVERLETRAGVSRTLEDMGKHQILECLGAKPEVYTAGWYRTGDKALFNFKLKGPVMPVQAWTHWQLGLGVRCLTPGPGATGSSGGTLQVVTVQAGISSGQAGCTCIPECPSQVNTCIPECPPQVNTCIPECPPRWKALEQCWPGGLD